MMAAVALFADHTYLLFYIHKFVDYTFNLFSKICFYSLDITACAEKQITFQHRLLLTNCLYDSEL